MFSLIRLLVMLVLTGYIAFVYESETVLLLVYMEAALFVLSFFMLLWSRIFIRGGLEIPVGIAEKGKDNMVCLRIRNRGILTLPRVRAKLVIKDLDRGKKEVCWKNLPKVIRGENEFVELVQFYGVGSYEISLRKLRIYDPTGLFYTTRRMKHTGMVYVMPQLHEVPVHLTNATRNFYGESDVYDENSPGYDNSELFQVREYRPGDRIQNIHWKLTAKQEELMVKEHALPKACPVILLLNRENGSWSRRRGKVPFLEAAASLSFSMVDAGCPHYVVWFDGTETDVMRLRVDDEESLYYFINVLMRTKWGHPGDNLLELYKEKYRGEPYIRLLELDGKLQLKQDGTLLVGLSARKLGQSLSKTELLL